jgi:adenosylhomocysteine nucleosidase
VALATLTVAGAENAKNPNEPVTAILGAQTREIILLRNELADGKERNILGFRFWEGRLMGRRVVITRMASGKVNAAMAATLIVEHFKPSEVIVTGIAGGLNPDLRPGDLVIAKYTVHHDVYRLRGDWKEYRGARNPIHGGRHPIYFEPPPRLLKAAQQAADRAKFIPIADADKTTTHAVKVIAGTVATGEAFIASDAMAAELRGKPLEADAVEMEGAAVSQACRQLETPCLVIRCMSDLATNTAVQDLEAFADVAAYNSAQLVREILRLLANESTRQKESGKAKAK